METLRLLDTLDDINSKGAILAFLTRKVQKYMEQPQHACMALQDWEKHRDTLFGPLPRMGASGIDTDDEDLHEVTVSMSALDPAKQSAVAPTMVAPATTAAHAVPPSTTPRPDPHEIQPGAPTPALDQGRHDLPALPGSSPTNSSRDTDKKRRSSPSPSTRTGRGAPPALSPKRARTSSGRSLRTKPARPPPAHGTRHPPFAKRKKVRKQGPVPNSTAAQPPIDESTDLHVLVKLEPMEETADQDVLKPAVAPIPGTENLVEVPVPVPTEPVGETDKQTLSKPDGTPVAAVPSSVVREATQHRSEQTTVPAQPATDQAAGEKVAVGTTPAITEADNSRPDPIDLAGRPVATPTPATTRVTNTVLFTPPTTAQKDVTAPAAHSAPRTIRSTGRARSSSPTRELVRRRGRRGMSADRLSETQANAPNPYQKRHQQALEWGRRQAQNDIFDMTPDHEKPSDNTAVGRIARHDTTSTLDYLRRQAWYYLKGRELTYTANNKVQTITISGITASSITDTFFGNKWLGGCVGRIIDIVSSAESFDIAATSKRAVRTNATIPWEFRAALRSLQYVKETEQSDTLTSLRRYLMMARFGSTWGLVRDTLGPNGTPDRRDALRSYCFGEGNHAAKSLTSCMQAAKVKLCALAGMKGVTFERSMECTYLPLAVIKCWGVGGLLFLPTAIDPARQLYDKRTALGQIMNIIDESVRDNGDWLRGAAEAIQTRIVGRVVNDEILGWPQGVLGPPTKEPEAIMDVLGRLLVEDSQPPPDPPRDGQTSPGFVDDQIEGDDEPGEDKMEGH